MKVFRNMKKIILSAAVAFVAASGFAQPKFAHVNMQELIQLMPAADSARATISASQKEAQDTFQSMYEEYQSKLNAYQQNADKWTAAIRQSKEKELGDIQQRLEEFNQSISSELQQQQQQLMAPIQQRAMEAVNRLAKSGGYVYVFDASSVLYIDDSQSTNLTPSARKALGIPDGRTLESLYEELQAQQQAQQQ